MSHVQVNNTQNPHSCSSPVNFRAAMQCRQPISVRRLIGDVDIGTWSAASAWRRIKDIANASTSLERYVPSAPQPLPSQPQCGCSYEYFSRVCIDAEDFDCHLHSASCLASTHSLYAFPSMLLLMKTSIPIFAVPHACLTLSLSSSS